MRSRLMLFVIFPFLQLIFSKSDEVGIVLFGTEGNLYLNVVLLVHNSAIEVVAPHSKIPTSVASLKILVAWLNQWFLPIFFRFIFNTASNVHIRA